MTMRITLPTLALCLLAGAAAAQEPNTVSGTIEQLAGTELSLRARDGTLVQIDFAEAKAEHRIGVLYEGAVVRAVGTRDAAGVLHAQMVVRAKPSPASWPNDR